MAYVNSGKAHSIHPEDCGATGDGDEGIKLQEWIDTLEDSPGTVGRMSARYYTSLNLRIKKPLTIRASGWGQDTNQASSPTGAVPGIQALNGCDDILTVGSETLGNRLWGVNLSGFYLSGDNRAKRLLVLNDTDHAWINLGGERATECGLDICEVNEMPHRYANIERWQYQSGGNNACRAGHGVRIEGTANGGATNASFGHITSYTRSYQIQHVTNQGGQALFKTTTDHPYQVGDRVLIGNNPIYQVEWRAIDSVPNSSTFTVDGVGFAGNAIGIVGAAAGLWVGDCDSSTWQRYQGGFFYIAGKRLDQTPPRRASRKNTFTHVAAHIFLGNGTISALQSINSEPSSITVFGKATINGVLCDRTDGRQYTFQTYVMSGTDAASGFNAVGSGSVTVESGGGKFPAQALPDGADSSLTWYIPPNVKWGKGKIARARVVYSGSASGGQVNTFVSIDTAGPGAGGGSWDAENIPAPIPSPSINNARTEAVIELDHEYLEGDGIYFRIERRAALPFIDTQSGPFPVFSVALDFEGKGPTDSPDHWMIPDMKV